LNSVGKKFSEGPFNGVIGFGGGGMIGGVAGLKRRKKKKELNENP